MKYFSDRKSDVNVGGLSNLSAMLFTLGIGSTIDYLFTTCAFSLD